MKFIEERIMDNVFFETEENVDFYLETVHRYILKMVELSSIIYK
jgi:hypothetical protein